MFLIDAENLRESDFQNAICIAEEKAFDYKVANRRYCRFAMIIYRNSDKIADKWPKIFDFDLEIENMALFAESIIDSLNNVPKNNSIISCDYISVINHALKDLSWGDGKKMFLLDCWWSCLW